MSDSLKTKLYNQIRDNFPNMFSLERVEALAKANGYKISNAERRLRELCDGDNPPIKKIWSEKGAIIGYIHQSRWSSVVEEIKPIQEEINKAVKNQDSMFGRQYISR
jgi:hypothetical protein